MYEVVITEGDSGYSYSKMFSDYFRAWEYAEYASADALNMVTVYDHS